MYCSIGRHLHDLLHRLTGAETPGRVPSAGEPPRSAPAATGARFFNRARTRVGVLIGLLSTTVFCAAAQAADPSGALLRRLVETGDVGPPALSPDGKTVIYSVTRARISTNDYTVDWFMKNLTSGGEPILLHEGSELRVQDGFPLAGRAAWSPDSQGALFPVAVGDDVSLFKLEVGSGRVQPFGSPRGAVQDFGFVDPGTVVVTHGPRPPAQNSQAPFPGTGGLVVPFGRVANLSIGPQGLVKAADMAASGRYLAGATAVIAWNTGAERAGGPDDRKALALTASPGSFSGLMVASVYEPITLMQQQFIPDRFPAAARESFYALSPDGRRVAVLVRGDDGVQTLEIAGAGEGGAGRGPVELPGSAPLRQLVWDRTGSSVYAVTDYSHDGFEIYRLAASGDRADLFASGPGSFLVASGIDAAGRLVGLWSDTSVPGDIAAVGAETAPVRLTMTNPAFPSPRKLGVTVTNAYGQPVSARVYVPEGCGQPDPCSVVGHIYASEPFPRGGTGDEWPFLELVRRGHVVIDASRPPDRTDVAPPGSRRANDVDVDAPLSGLLALIDRLAAEGLVDRERAGIVGLSFGAQVATRGALTTDRFKAASASSASLYALPGLLSMGFPTDSASRAPSSFAGSQDEFLIASILEGDAKAFATYMGLDAARTTSTAFLVHENDEEYRTSLLLMSLLEVLNKPVEMVVFANEGHVKTQPRNRLEVYTRNADWFDYWLLDKRDPDAAKAGQYRRWDRLRARLNE